MKFKNFFLLAVALACTIFTLVSCKSLTIGLGGKGRHGPPPHAPAHGYRHKQHGAELTYDSGRGVYVVVGFPGHYYYRDHYYRFGGVRWEVGAHIDGPWKSVSVESLPPGLRDKDKGKGKSKEPPGRGLGTKK